MIFGIIIMSLFGALRGSGDFALTENQDWYQYTRDLIVNNRNLYVIYDYVDKNGILWGISFLGPLLSVIPFLQSLVANALGIPYYLLASPAFTTYLEFGDYPPLGLGSNIVADVYLAFGLFGVLISFYLLGRFIVYSRMQMWKGKIYYMIVYYIMSAGAIYMCRDTFLHSFKTIVWAIALIYIISKLSRRSV